MEKLGIFPEDTMIINGIAYYLVDASIEVVEDIKKFPDDLYVEIYEGDEFNDFWIHETIYTFIVLKHKFINYGHPYEHVDFGSREPYTVLIDKFVKEGDVVTKKVKKDE